MDDRSHLRKCWEASSSADRHEVVHADALHDEEPACGVDLAVHVMRGLRRHRTALARQETIDMARCPCLDHHRPLKTNEAVADLSVVMPRHALAGRKGQHLHAQIRTLGNQLVAGDCVIAAVARLHRSVLLYSNMPARWRRRRRFFTTAAMQSSTSRLSRYVDVLRVRLTHRWSKRDSNRWSPRERTGS